MPHHISPYHTCIISYLYQNISYYIIWYHVISYHNDSCDLDVNVVFVDVHNRVKNTRFPTLPINLQASPPLVRNESAKTAGTFGGADPISGRGSNGNWWEALRGILRESHSGLYYPVI